MKQEPSDINIRIIEKRFDKSLLFLHRNIHEDNNIIGVKMIKTIRIITSLKAKHSDSVNTSVNEKTKVSQINPEILVMIINHLRSESILAFPFSVIVIPECMKLYFIITPCQLPWLF